MLATGDRIPDVDVWLAPREGVSLHDLVSGRTPIAVPPARPRTSPAQVGSSAISAVTA